MKKVYQKNEENNKVEIKLPEGKKRLLLIGAIVIIVLAVILILTGLSSAAPLSGNYNITYSANPSSGLMYGQIQATTPNLTHTTVNLQIVYQGTIMLQKNFTGTTTFSLPMTTGVYTFQITTVGNNASASILFYQQINGGLSSSKTTGFATILESAGVIGGILAGQLIIAISSNFLFIRKLVKDGETIGEGIYKGTDDNEVFEHKKTLNQPMTELSQVAEWLKQKKYLNIDTETNKEGEKGNGN